LAFSAFSAFLFLNSLYLQEVRHLSALHAGLCTLPLALAVIAFAPLSGRLAGRGRARLALLTAGASLAIGALALTRMDATTPLPWLLGAYAIFGVGIGMVNAPITNSAVSGMPRAQAGVASAVASTSRQVGATLGVAFAGSIVGSAMHGAGSVGFAAATHLVWWLLAGCGVLVAVTGFASTSAWAAATARRIAYMLDEPASRDDDDPVAVAP
jgi:MFS family permease